MSADLDAGYAAFRQWCPETTRSRQELGWALKASGAVAVGAEWLEELSPRWARGRGPDPFYEPNWNGQYHELRFENA